MTARTLALAEIAAAGSGTAWPDRADGADAPDLVSGQDIYEEFRAACHGFEGVRIIPEAPNFANGESFEKEDPELPASIRDGKGEIMPLWSDDLSERQVRDVLAYIRTLRRPE